MTPPPVCGPGERKAILDGEEVVLRETSDVSTGGLTELSAGNMSQYSWYLVSYNADGFVTNAEIIDATEPATNLEYVSDYTGGAIQTAIDGSGIDAVGVRGFHQLQQCC